MWGCTEARLLEGPELFDKGGFSHDIAGYTAELLSSEGITKPPDILKFAEFNPAELDQRALTLSTDPVVAEAYWTTQEEARKGLEDFALKNMKDLIKEIESLPLKNGEAAIPESFKN
jgi:hypothetical protein